MLKATGIVRKVDELGRVVIPKELRTTLDISVGAPLEIFVNGSQIILTKYQPGCDLCGELVDVVSFKNKKVCKHCADGLVKVWK